MKKFGTYTYSAQAYIERQRRYVTEKMRVEVVAEKGNRYQIKYLGFHINGAAVNSLHWVRKDKVKLDNTEVDPAKVILRPPIYIRDDRSMPDNVRLPYKDND